MGTIGDRLYTAVVLPYDSKGNIDETAYRRLIRYYLSDPRFLRQGGLCVNPEAGEIFYLTRQEKRRVVEIAMEEAHGKLPIFAGTWANTTAEVVETAKDVKAVGADGLFIIPPGGSSDITSNWDYNNHPEIWLDQIKEQDRAVDLPIIAHPTGPTHPPLAPGLPLNVALKICREVPNIVGWKMTYGYDGFRIVARGLRTLDRHVAILGALAVHFHEEKAAETFDGTLSGFWNYALEPMLDHLEAWDNKDLDRARAIWNAGLYDLQDYVAEMSRLHIRYKIATWLRGLIPNPFMRPPMPKPERQEIDAIYNLLKKVNLPVIDLKGARLAA